MQRIGTLAVTAVVVLVAPNVWAQAPSCQTVEFSQRVVEALPDVRDLCLRIEEREGQQFAVVEAEVSRVYKSDAVQVRFKRADGSKSSTRYFKTAPERRFLIEGKPTRVQDLVVGQDLTTFIHVTEPVIAPEPVRASDPLDPVPFQVEPE
jgi:hypothetical protein